MPDQHHAEAVVREFAGKLAARARHVCLLLGAGSSASAGLPTVAQLEVIVTDSLVDPHKSFLTDLLDGRNLEQVLSRIRRMRSLLGPTEVLAGMSAVQAAELDHMICAAVTTAVDATGKDITAFVNLASWASRMETHRPVEIFTVNYDLLIEAGLEELGVPYFDGFVGGVRGRFAPELIEPTDSRPETRLPPGFVRLWKLHGSTNWTASTIGTRHEIVRTAVAVGDAVAIYPSDEKYDESRRLPFVALLDRFRRALVEPETITLVSGYSFGDEHLNEMLFDAAQRHPRSEVVALCHGDIPPVVEQRAASTRNLVALSPKAAIIDGHKAAWASGDDIPGVFEGDTFLLGDFTSFATFLARQVSPDVLGS
jgi:hypothetical protein